MRLLRYYGPAIVWTALILAASSDLFSSMHTGLWLATLLERLFGWHPHPHAVDDANFWTRKGTHVFAYGTLAALWFRALRGGRAPSWLWPWAWRAVAITAAIASLDEFHQTFVPSRTGTFSDVLLDTGGAVLAQAIIRLAQVLLFRP
jgi:VanZ family protein